MNILEKTLEDIVFNTPNEILKQKGLYINGKKKRQVRIGNYGIADIVTVNKEYAHGYIPCLVFTVYELKQNKVDAAAFWQAIRYANGINRWLNENKNFPFKIRIALIGTSIDMHHDFLYLANIADSPDVHTDGIGIDYYIMHLDINGVTFENQNGFRLNDEGF